MEPAAAVAVWQQRLGTDFDAFKEAFLHAGGNISGTFPCSQLDHPGCGAYEIRARMDDYVGVCESGVCPSRSFKKEELWEYALQRKEILTELANCLSLNASVSESVAEFGIWHIGRHRPNTHFDFPVFVALCPAHQDINSGIRELLGRHSRPFLLGLLSENNLSDDTRGRLTTAKVQTFELEAVANISDSRFSVTAAWSQVLAQFNSQAVPQAEFKPAKVKKYPTPKNACWADVRIRMQTGDDANVMVDGPGSPGWLPYDFRELGMAQENGNKNKAWQFFVDVLAENYGGPVCPKPAQKQTYESRKREIARALIDVFGISGDPLPFLRTPPDIGYKTAFILLPAGAE